MRQSTVVILVLFLAFIVYVTMRGELPTYLGLLGIGSSTTGSTTADATTATVDPNAYLAPSTVSMAQLPTVYNPAAVAGNGITVTPPPPATAH